MADQDVPYTMKLPGGRMLYIDIPARYVEKDRSGAVAFTPEGVRFLDRVRALALPTNLPPRPTWLANLREALGMTQAQLAEKLDVDKMTVSRWERGAMKPGPDAVARIRRLADRAKRHGVVLAE